MKKLILFSLLIFVLLVGVICIGCDLKPGKIKQERYRDHRIQVVEHRRVLNTYLILVEDRKTGSEFLISSSGGIVKINE